MKSTVIILAVLVTVLSGGLAAMYYQNASRSKGELEEERIKRFMAEEELEKIKSKISSLEGDISKKQNKIVSLEKSLEQMTAFNNDLKDRMEKAKRLKEEMDAKIAELERIAGMAQQAAQTPLPPEAAQVQPEAPAQAVPQ